MMNAKLSAENFEIEFQMEYQQRSRDLDVNIVLRILDVDVAQNLSVHTWFFVSDLIGFHTYLRKYLEQPALGRLEASPYEFVTHHLGFYFSPNVGEIWKSEEPGDERIYGEFALRCMLRFHGKTNGSSVYVGAQGQVLLEQAQSFLEQLDTAGKHFQTLEAQNK